MRSQNGTATDCVAMPWWANQVQLTVFSYDGCRPCCR
jgi:hypothetical protein